MSLLDQFKQNIQQAASPAQAPVSLPQTGALSKLSSQVRTGKAGSAMDTEAGLSDQAERQALQQGAQARQQLAGQAALQTEQLAQAEAAQEQQFNQQEFEIKERRLNQAQDFNQKLTSMLSEFERNISQLDLRKQNAKYEQLGFLMRLSDDKYINELQNNGKRARLDNELSFKENLQKAVFKDEQDLLSSNLQFRSMMNADERKFQEELTKMNLDTALELAMASASQANTQMMYQGLGGLVTAGSQAYVNTQDYKIKEEERRRKLAELGLSEWD